MSWDSKYKTFDGHRILLWENKKVSFVIFEIQWIQILKPRRVL